jgi:hypothetical protein
VGGADLSVEFVVTDANSGQPIPGARVNISCDGGFYNGVDEDRKGAFDIRTDAAGIARRLLRNNRCIGTQSLLKFTDTYHVYTSAWNLRAFAEGYRTSEWIHLWKDYDGKAERDGPEKDRLIVPVAVQKAVPRVDNRE